MQFSDWTNQQIFSDCNMFKQLDKLYVSSDLTRIQRQNHDDVQIGILCKGLVFQGHFYVCITSWKHFHFKSFYFVMSHFQMGVFKTSITFDSWLCTLSTGHNTQWTIHYWFECFDLDLATLQMFWSAPANAKITIAGSRVHVKKPFLDSK